MHPRTQPAPTPPARHRPSASRAAARAAAPAAVAAWCVAVLCMALAAIPRTATGGLRPADDASPARAAAARAAATFTLAGDWPIPPSAGAEVVAATSLCPNIGAPTGVPGAGFAANGVLHIVATCYNRPQLSAIDPDGRIVWGGMLGWNVPSVVTFEPFTQRVVGAFRETAGRLVVAAHPLAGSAYTQRTWNVPGGDGDDRGLPLAMAPGPGGRIVAFSPDGLTGFGPGIERSGPTVPLGAPNRRALPGSIAVDGAGARYVLDPTAAWGVIKLTPDGRRTDFWTVEGLAAGAGMLAGYPDGDHLGVLEPTTAGNWQLRAFRPDGSLVGVHPIDTRIASARAPLLAMGPGGAFAVVLHAGPRVQIAWHAADGTLRRWLDLGPNVNRAPTDAFGLNVSVIDGRAVVRFGRRRDLIRFDRAGVTTTLFTPPPLAADVAELPDGGIVVRRRAASDLAIGVVERFDDVGQLRWSTPVSDTGAGLAVDDRFVYAAQSEHSAVVMLDAADGSVAGRIDLLAEEGFFPDDIARAPDGSITAVDGAGRQVQVWDVRTPFRPVRTIALPSTDGVWRVAAGPGGLIAVVGRWTDGPPAGAPGVAPGATPGSSTVRVLDATGAVLWRLENDPRIDLAAFAPQDVAFDADGRLVVAAEAIKSVEPARLWTFDLNGGAAAAPPPPPTAPPPPPANGGPCRVQGGKTAAPREIWLGETVTVTLSLRRTCPDASSVADIVLAVDVSGSMGGVKQTAAADAVEAFVGDIDLSRHRIGLVTFSNTARLLHPLSSDPAVVRDVPASYGAGGGTNIAAALIAADAHLAEAARPEARQVIVLISDGGSDPDQAMAAALAARRRGVRIFTVGVEGAANTLLLRIAGRAEQHYGNLRPEDLPALYRQLATLIASGAGAAVLDDTLSPDVDLVPATFNRPPQIAFGAGLRWGLGADFGAPVTLTYQVRPLRTGLVPTNTAAWVDYLDGDGVVRRFTYPVPEVLVRAPTATPSATPTVTPTPTPTATPIPRPIYLPIALREAACKPSARHADVAIVIDASTSMLERAPSGRTKLDIALDGVRGFLDRLDLDDAADRDRAAVIAFNAAATLLQPLTADRAALDAALGRVAVAPQTCIVCGVETAIGALVDARRDAMHTPVLVLLTDGRSNPRPVAEAEAAAATARARGIVVFTIALGDDVDAEALARMASRPAFAFRAPTADDLAAIYGAVAGAIPCPAGGHWGGR
ncbi:MAG: VWA domain-containing protein [Ardenticatenales bacterium]|nr:VWA domain-containing protein [Ardenticatenales bacterium]